MSLKDKRVLYISYNGMLDPLGQSQVIPYLRELSGEGVRFTLLSFERAGAFEHSGLEKCGQIERGLAEYGIEWHRLRYHQRPSLPATIYDVTAGVIYGRWLVRRNRIEMVHARNPVMATIALGLKRLSGVKMVFDVRGLLADEYADSGHWERSGFKYRITRSMERRCIAASDGLVTLTERIWPIIQDWPELRGRSVAHQVIPCCVDLERFAFDPVAREARRAELKLEGKFVLVYSGSFGGWYLSGEMMDFFAALMKQRRDSHFLWLGTTDHARVESLMRARGIAPTDYTIRSIQPPAHVSSYLSASDAGIAFIKPCPSKVASSPTKNAEYLACGLPLIINAGIGDCDGLMREGVGALVSDFNDEEYRRAARTVFGLIEDVEIARRRSREVARRLFDVSSIGLERYSRLYEEVCGGPTPMSHADVTALTTEI